MFFGSLCNAKSKESAHVLLREGTGKNLDMFLLKKGNFIMINEFRYGQTWKIWPSAPSLSLYSTFKSKLWHNKTEANNIKVANGGIYQNLWPCKFNFDHIFSSIVLPLSADEKWFSKHFVWVKWVSSFCLECWWQKPGGDFCLGHKFSFLTNKCIFQ